MSPEGQHAENRESATTTVSGVWRECVDEMRHVKVDAVAEILEAGRGRTFAAVVWSLILAANACACIWLTMNITAEYSKKQISATNRYIVEEQATFPTITLCNKNQFTSGSALALLRLTNSMESLKRGHADTFQIYADMQAYVKNTTGRYMSAAEKRALSSDIGDMVVACEFQGQQCNVSRDFSYMFHPYYLNCFSFNGDGKSRVNIAGLTSQFKLELYAGVPDEISYLLSRGFHVFIQNASEYPLNYAPSPYELTPAFGKTFMPQRTFYHQLEHPYSECTVSGNNELTEPLGDTSLFDQLVADEYSYSQDDCVLLCKQLIFGNTCRCLNLAIDYIPPSVIARESLCAYLFFSSFENAFNSIKCTIMF